jgi:type II secretory pathway pseudopilin PulG
MFVVNVTSVPFCTGVPAPAVDVDDVPLPFPLPFVGGTVVTPFSMTVAMISTSPFAATFDADEKTVITVPAGASSGTLSQATANAKMDRAVRSADNERGRREPQRLECVSIIGVKDNTLMYLEGQDGQRGYAMAALLVMIAIMAIGMSALLPVWRQQSIREKEAELAFRGEQYARAIYLFRTKNGNQPPPNVDVLVDGRYLRRKYKDPITGEDFQPIYGGQQPQQPGSQGRGAPQGRGNPQGRAGGPTQGGIGSGRAGLPTPTNVGSGLSGAQGAGQAGAGLVTVQSKSKEPSIRIYNNASYYNQWQFLYNARGRGGVPGAERPGAPGTGTDRGRGPGRGVTPGPAPGGGRGPGRGFSLPGGRGQ